jgi:hypothetical protein
MKSDDYKPVRRASSGLLFEAFENISPAVINMLRTEDDRRMLHLFELNMHMRGLLDAFEELVVLTQDLAGWGDAIAEEPYTSIAVRVHSDVQDAINGVLTGKSAAIMDACRDLMELAALLRDFREEPQRIAKWVKSDESNRGRDFGFSHLMRKSGKPLEFMGTNVSANLAEYTYHSRNLHPAMWKGNSSELDRSAELPQDAHRPFWLASFGSETVKHGLAAAFQLLLWFAKQKSDQEPEDFVFPPPNDAMRSWLDTHYQWMEDNVDRKQYKEFEAERGYPQYEEEATDE